MKYGKDRKTRNRIYAPLPTQRQIEGMRDVYSGAVEEGILPKIEPVDPGPPSLGQPPAPEIALGTLDVIVGRAWKALLVKLRMR